MGIPAEISQHGLGSTEGWFGINHPFYFAEWCQPGDEGISFTQPSQIAVEAEFTRTVQSQQPLNEQTLEQSRQHPNVQKEPRLARDPRLAIERQPSARNDHMNVRMMSQRRPPSVQNAGHANLRAEAFGIGGDGRHCFCRCLK